MDDGDSRPPTRPASPSIIVEEPHSLPRIISPLHRATEEDDIRKVMELLAAGADINEKAWDGRTPLHVCAQTNNTVMAEVLLYKSATINVVDDAGKEPLRTALDTGSTEVACMLLSRGGSLEALSGFIVDVAQREHMSEKRLILRCFGCVADEGKEDELLDLLSTSTHGAPVSLENALMEILHEAESSYMSETVGLAKSFSDRKAKLPVTSSEPKREVDRESDLDIQAVHAQANVRSVEDSGESKHLQGVEPLAKPDEKRIRSVEVALAENPENDASSASARPGTSVPTTSKGATCDDGIPKLLDHWAPTKTTVYGVDEFYGMDDLGDSMAHQEIVPVSAQMAEPSKGLESLACDTQAISQPISNIETPDIDALSGVKTTSSDNVPFKPVFHKQFSWEVAVSDDATSASAAEQVDSEQATELYWATPQSPPPCLPSGHLFGIPLQDLCDHQEVPVPRIVLDCISILEQSASDLSGIYQHPPEPILVDKLRDFMETGELRPKLHDYQMLISIRFTTKRIPRYMATGAQGSSTGTSETISSRTARFSSTLRPS
jgi:ankyrin repeat protein